jgi:hypothetical protein
MSVANAVVVENKKTENAQLRSYSEIFVDELMAYKRSEKNYAEIF